MKSFRLEKNGYNKEDVNSFASYVLEELDSAVLKMKEQNDTILKLQKEAEENSNQIVTHAKEMASQIVNEALMEAEEVEEKRKELIRIKNEITNIIQQHKNVEEELNRLKLND